MNSGARMRAHCSASKRRRHEPDELHIIPYLCCYKLKLNWPSSGAAVRGSLGAVVVTMCLSTFLNRHSLLIWMSCLGKEIAFWKYLLIQGSSYICNIWFFSASISWDKSCSELLLNWRKTNRWKTTTLRPPQPSDRRWALIFHLFRFVLSPKDNFIPSSWARAEKQQNISKVPKFCGNMSLTLWVQS